ncbi:GNAT family N-acetyltransferase [Chitinimonas lacunae]|uniref:GNAT family N-acetyltransferase n=1 Tax=Chitinimonas lacunae TaxID=1963018 RepID=A0ABV8MLD1_9NEIS
MIVDSVDAIARLDVARWNALAGSQPFIGHGFLAALEQSGAVGGKSGWMPCHLALRQDDHLLGAMPLYLKSHSYGEYVFDWSWADAYQRAGGAYYPKLVCAVPFTPVPGPRLLADSLSNAERLLDGAVALAERQALSSIHLLFPEPVADAALRERGWLCREGVQFHWHNAGYRDFADFLAALSHDKRKKIRQERRRLAEAGVEVVRRQGAAITAEDWAFFYRCYVTTYLTHRSTPYLSLDFFERLGTTLPESCLLILAYQNGRPIAAALDIDDGTRLYGRYWGAEVYVPNLHFELCYYQGIEHAIARGLAVFEGGAQGEHKLARGFTPVRTRSFHWLADPVFRLAVERFLQREERGVTHYLSELDERLPFRHEPLEI